MALIKMEIPDISNNTGKTLPDIYKELNIKLKKESGENYDLSSLNVRSGKVDPYIGSMKLLIFDALKYKEGVISALLSDDPTEISRALKCSWFFDGSIEPQFFETDILPVVSYSTRCRIINKLSRNLKNESQVEHLFNFVLQNYGSNTAEILLPKCSRQFISTYISVHKPLFKHNTSPRVLLNISKRYPELVVPVLENIYVKDCSIQLNDRKTTYTMVLMHLAKYHKDLFVPFFAKNYSQLLFLKFGKKLTKALTPQIKEIIINSNGELQEGVINEYSMFKALTTEDQIHFLANVIKSKKKQLSFGNWNLALSDVTSLIKTKPEKERLFFFESTFSQVYNQNLWDHPEIWKTSLLELLPLDFRIRCAERLKNLKTEAEIEVKTSRGYYDEEKEPSSTERTVEEKLYYLLDCQQSIPKLKSLLLKCPTAATRKVILLEMVKSCGINKDLKALESLCEYIAQRHRNEDPVTLVGVLHKISSCFNVKKLTPATWDKIEEIITICNLNGSVGAGFNFDRLYEKYILTLYEKGLECPEKIKYVIKFQIAHRNYSYNFLDVRSPFARKLFFDCYHELPKYLEDNQLKEEDRENIAFSLLEKMNLYNLHNKKTPIDVREFDFLLKEVDANIERNPNRNYQTYHLYHNPYLREKYATVLLKNEITPELLMFLMKKRPYYIVESLEDILDELYDEFTNRFEQFVVAARKFYAFLNMTDKIKQLTREKFEKGDSFTRKFNALRLYSYFAGIEDYSNLVKEYFPKTERIDYEKDSTEFVKLQLTVPRLIRHIKPDSKNFQLVSKFLTGDFLKPVHGSFNSACYNSPISKALSFLLGKMDNPVAVKKAVLRAHSAIAPLQDKMQFYHSLWSKEKHYSIRTIILDTIKKCFLENPTDSSFKILKQCITESDELIVEARPDVRSVPSGYVNEYAITLWEFTDKLKQLPKNNIRKLLLESFNPYNIGDLSDEFCRGIVEEHLFDDSSKMNVTYFASYYLLSKPEEVEKKLDFYLSLMSKGRENKVSISMFLESLFTISLDETEIRAGLNVDVALDGLHRKWFEIFDKSELFKEYLFLRYHQCYRKIKQQLPPKGTVVEATVEFGKHLREILNDRDELCFVYVDTIRSFVKSLESQKLYLDLMLLVKTLVAPELSRLRALAAVMLLPDSAFKKRKVTEIQAGDVADSVDEVRNVSFVFYALKNLNDHATSVYLNSRFLENERKATKKR